MIRHPGIWQIGKVIHLGPSYTKITGWGLSPCPAGCSCHDPLKIVEDQMRGQISLAHHRPCPCCQPWTWQELEAIIRDAAEIGALETA